MLRTGIASKAPVGVCARSADSRSDVKLFVNCRPAKSITVACPRAAVTAIASARHISRCELREDNVLHGGHATLALAALDGDSRRDNW